MAAQVLAPFTVLLSLLAAVGSASNVGTVYLTPKTDIRVGTTLANGKSFQAGFINNNVRWQASGILTVGGCLRPGLVLPRSCYQMALNAAGNLESGGLNARAVLELGGGGPGNRSHWGTTSSYLTPEERATLDDFALDDYFEAFPEQAQFRYRTQELGSSNYKRQAGACPPPVVTTTTTTTKPSTTKTSLSSTSTSSTSTIAPTPTPTGKQRIELFSWPGALPKETWNYQWKSWLRTGVSTSAHFFHSWQILRRDLCGGPVVTLDWKAGQAVMTDTVLGCTSCIKVQIRPFSSTMVFHSMNVTYGLQGGIDYVCTSNSGAVLIEYHSHNRDMGSSGSIKMGTYRAIIEGASATAADVADFVGTRLA